MTTRRRRRPTGFTLTEMIVVTLLIGIMFGIIAPALTRGLATSRRIQCLNNMRQIGLATQNYDQQFRCLPPGVVNPTGPIYNRPDDMHLGWVIQILPYLEQNGIARSINTEVSIYSSANASVAPRLNSLSCPADANAGVLLGRGTSSFAGCHHDVEAPIDADNHGVFFLNSHVRYDDITDGTSFTIFFGEKLVIPPDLGWGSGTRATLRNTGTPLNADPALVKGTTASADPGALHVGGFASRHPGGANFSFGDGSVRFVRESIDLNVYRLLGHRADGETIGGDEL